jgi:hypothetical protein
MTRMQKLIVGFALTALLFGTRPVHAVIVHRYLLDGNTNDSVGTLHLAALDDFAPGFVADNKAGGQSAEFTGMHAVLGDVPEGDPLRSSVFSLSFWMKYGAQPSGFGMPIARADGTNRPWVVQINPDGALRWIVEAANVGDTTPLNTGGGDADPWHHVVISQNHDVGSVYIDGAPVHQNAPSPISSAIDAKPLRLGRRGDGFLFAGRLDDVQIYSDALQPADVTFLFTNPGQVVVPAPPSTDFNGLNGTDIADFHILRSNFLKTGATHAEGDANLNGKVEHRDYFLWRSNFLAAGGSVAAIDWSPVPEPSTYVLVMSCGLIVNCFRRTPHRIRK